MVRGFAVSAPKTMWAKRSKRSLAKELALPLKKKDGLRSAPLFQFVDVIENSPRNANDQDFEIAPGFVLYPSRNVNNHAFVNFDFFIIEPHSAFAIDNIIKLVGTLMKMQFSICDFDEADFACCAVFLGDEEL